jgi:SAM-dependent methyltransferase
MISPITGQPGSLAFTVDGYTYWRDNSGSLYGESIDQSGMVGGSGDRTEANGFRCGLVPKGKRVLDYGCGRGELVKAFQERGYDAEGYDPYSEKYGEMPSGLFDYAFMVEVIEHTTAPFRELSVVRELLHPGGILLIETSFSDWVGEGHPYANPRIGHQTIFSHLGLDFLMLAKGFAPFTPHLNQNIRAYRIPE